MNHSVRAYLERIPLSKLEKFLDDNCTIDNYDVDDDTLRHILEVSIIRNLEDGYDLSAHIRRMQAIFASK